MLKPLPRRHCPRRARMDVTVFLHSVFSLLATLGLPPTIN